MPLEAKFHIISSVVIDLPTGYRLDYYVLSHFYQSYETQGKNAIQEWKGQRTDM